MERKYQILSAATVMKMMMRFQDNEGIPYSMPVGVDLLNNKVYFETDESGIDYEDLEQEILAYLRPVGPESLQIPAELMQRINEIKNGKYGTEKYEESEGES